MLTKFMTAGLALAITCLGATASLAQQSTMPTKPGANGTALTISCFRGPWKDVIWDRPNAIFVQSLVDRGYTYAEAEGIGERVCRDEHGVGNPEHLRKSLKEAMTAVPPGRKR